MSIQYAGGTIINTTFTQSTGTRAEIVSNLITQLLAAGWTLVSGSGTDQVLKCAATATGVTGLQIAVRVYDPGSGNCARVALRNVSGTRIGQDLYLFPAASKTWRIIANKYQFFIFTPGSSAPREFAAAGQLCVPSWLTSVTVNAGWANGNAISDTDTTAKTSFRTNLAPLQTVQGRTTALASDTLLDIGSSNSSLPTPELLIPQAGFINAGQQNTNGYRWADNTLLVGDALLAMGIASITDEAKVYGQLWDAALVNDSFAADSNISLDGHTWWGITVGNTGTSQYAHGTLFIAVT